MPIPQNVQAKLDTLQAAKDTFSDYVADEIDKMAKADVADHLAAVSTQTRKDGHLALEAAIADLIAEIQKTYGDPPATVK